jgi:transcription antitermination factor NusA-like protein
VQGPYPAVYQSDFPHHLSRSLQPDLEAYIVNALSPAPARAIRHIFVYREERRARVIVERGTIRAFLGKAATNVATASKLTGIGIEPFDESELAGGNNLRRRL